MCRRSPGGIARSARSASAASSSAVGGVVKRRGAPAFSAMTATAHGARSESRAEASPRTTGRRRAGWGAARMVAKLTEAERAALAQTLPEWRMVPGRDAIARSFRFADFSAAWGFMSRVALLAEK